MRKLRYAAKVLGGTLSPRGRSKIDLNISKDKIAGRIQLPGLIAGAAAGAVVYGTGVGVKWTYKKVSNCIRS